MCRFQIRQRGSPTSAPSATPIDLLTHSSKGDLGCFVWRSPRMWVCCHKCTPHRRYTVKVRGTLPDPLNPPCPEAAMLGTFQGQLRWKMSLAGAGGWWILKIGQSSANRKPGDDMNRPQKRKHIINDMKRWSSSDIKDNDTILTPIFHLLGQNPRSVRTHSVGTHISQLLLCNDQPEAHRWDR